MNVWNLIYSDVCRYIDHGEFKNVKLNKTGKLNIFINALFSRHHCVSFLFWLRILGSDDYPPLSPMRLLARYKYRCLRNKYGLQIPPSCSIGPGLYIGHGIGIVVNSKTKIGSRCNLMHHVTIGSNYHTPATIGDNVWIGPNVCIVEDVKIGNNVKIGAGTVVINDIPDNATSVGNPNRIIIKAHEQL